jgi:sugar/nucleoside kinase (ribokinase family)
VDLLKLSEEEIDMVGGYTNILPIMKEYDIPVVILTKGSKGSELFYKGISHKISGFKVNKVADTTGAGDAFWGGFLSSILLQGISKQNELELEILKNAVIYGNASGSLAVREKGAIKSLPTRKKIEQFLQENE